MKEKAQNIGAAFFVRPSLVLQGFLPVSFLNFQISGHLLYRLGQCRGRRLQ